MCGKAVLIALAVLFSGCTTMRPAVSPVPGASEYRETQAEIRQQQAELAITGAKVGEGSQEIVGEITSIEIALADPDYDREILINQVHDLRIMAEKHQADTETLNRQLAEERETGNRLETIFNEREETWQKALSERETENTALKLENKKIASQRNTLLAIVLTAAGIILVIIAVKVLRALKIIPI
jgi:hypothetical protein